MIIIPRSVVLPFLRSVAAVLSWLLIIAAPAFAADAGRPAPALRTVDLGNGVTIHYEERGSGAPVVFVHGSIGDYSYWDDQIAAFGTRYRAIAYSRRYNYPNTNPARPGYSAVTDADDLAALIRTLHLGRAYVIGHSYGALTALFLAIRHPELVRAMVLAEPPAVTLLQHLPDEQTAKGEKLFADIQSRMVTPMKAAFAKNDRDAGVATFINYVLDDSAAWAKMSPSARADTMRDAHEWDVMMTSGTLFPEVDPAAIRRIKVPVLVMSGGVSYEFLGYIDQEIVRLIPHSRSIVYPDAGHQMWLKYPTLCRDDAEAFFDDSARNRPH